MKSYAKSALCALYKYSGAMTAQEHVSYWAGQSFMSILLFHRVTDDIPEDGLTVNTRWFGRMCRMLKQRFHVVPLAEIVRILQSGEAPPRRTVAITFDDCYRDNLFAARVLADFELPACFFVPTAYLGTDHVFEWDRGLKKMPNLSWDDARAMVRLGHEIGSHTVTHPNLTQVSVAEMRRELVDSRKMIEDHLGRPARWFAYPFGTTNSFRPERLPLVYEAGYQACFSGYGGFVLPGMLREVLPREPVPYFRSLLNLELHLSGCLNWLYTLKRKVGLIAVH